CSSLQAAPSLRLAWLAAERAAPCSFKGRAAGGIFHLPAGWTRIYGIRTRLAALESPERSPSHAVSRALHGTHLHCVPHRLRPAVRLARRREGLRPVWRPESGFPTGDRRGMV